MSHQEQPIPQPHEDHEAQAIEITRLQDGESVSFTPEPFAETEANYYGLEHLPVVAEIDAGQNRVVVFRHVEYDQVGEQTGNFEIGLAALTPTEDGGLTYVVKGIFASLDMKSPGSAVVGRKMLEDQGYAPDKTMSRDHAVIMFDGHNKLRVKDLHSTNKTFVHHSPKGAKLEK